MLTIGLNILVRYGDISVAYQWIGIVWNARIFMENLIMVVSLKFIVWVAFYILYISLTNWWLVFERNEIIDLCWMECAVVLKSIRVRWKSMQEFQFHCRLLNTWVMGIFWYSIDCDVVILNTPMMKYEDDSKYKIYKILILKWKILSALISIFE